MLGTSNLDHVHLCSFRWIFIRDAVNQSDEGLVRMLLFPEGGASVLPCMAPPRSGFVRSNSTGECISISISSYLLRLVMALPDRLYLAPSM